MWLLVFGLVCAAIGLTHLIFGASSIIAGGSVNATIDSDLRFYALLFTAYGLGFVWCAELVLCGDGPRGTGNPGDQLPPDPRSGGPASDRGSTGTRW
jgi:hypothetical protein